MGRFALSDAPFDIAPLRARLLDARAGGFASFEGWVRNVNEGRAVHALTYEAYTALAEAEGEKVLAEAVERFAIVDAACVHRVGRLELGEMAVWVGVSAGHRDGAFAACRWIIDEVKARVPIWKHEHYADGDAGWLHPEAGQDPVGGACAPTLSLPATCAMAEERRGSRPSHSGFRPHRDGLGLFRPSRAGRIARSVSG